MVLHMFKICGSEILKVVLFVLSCILSSYDMPCNYARFLQQDLFVQLLILVLAKDIVLLSFNLRNCLTYSPGDPFLIGI